MTLPEVAEVEWAAGVRLVRVGEGAPALRAHPQPWTLCRHALIVPTMGPCRPRSPRSSRSSCPAVRLSCLAWGPADGPLVVALHGFPDTAWTWRHLGPHLAARGMRVVAPFLRGYAPSGLAATTATTSAR